MPSPDKDHVNTARRLREACTNGEIQPLRDVLDPIDAKGAYLVQQINTDYWIEQGRKIAGRKIGLTANAVQAQLGVNQPDFGVLFDDMQVLNNGTEKAASEYGLDTREILVELGNRRMVGGQEDMIVDVALDLVEIKAASRNVHRGHSCAF